MCQDFIVSFSVRKMTQIHWYKEKFVDILIKFNVNNHSSENEGF